MAAGREIDPKRLGTDAGIGNSIVGDCEVEGKRGEAGDAIGGHRAGPSPALTRGQMLKSESQVSVSRNVFPPTPPGPEGSNGNGLFRVQWVAGAWLFYPPDYHDRSPLLQQA